MAAPNRLEPGDEVSRELIRVNSRAPIQFKAFAVEDPTNHRPISRDAILTLPDGRKLTAGQYYDELNRLESEFNKIGYTLKEPGDRRTELQVTPVPVATFQDQAQKFSAGYIDTKMLNSKTAAQVALLGNTPSPALLTSASKSLASNNFSWNSPVWNYSVGNPSVFAASINGKSSLTGTPTAVTIHGEANASGSIFNQQFDLLNATADLNAPASGAGNVKLGVKVVGISVYNLNQNVITSWSKTDTLQKTLDKSKTINFMLGPIPMNAKIGAAGSAGFTYTVAVAPVKASAQIAPFVHTKVYVQAGANVAIGGAGAGANLTLVNLDGNLNGMLGISAKNNKLYYDWSSSYSQNVNMLSGNAYVYVYVYTPCWCPSSGWVTKKQWDWNIFSWSGFSKSGTLFNNSGSAPI
jgi:hypothetical protein